jgi:hypothetical protein
MHDNEPTKTETTIETISTLLRGKVIGERSAKG